MKNAWRIIVPTVVILGVAGGVILWRSHHQAAAESAATAAAPEEAPEPGTIGLEPEQVEAAGIKTTPLTASTLAPEVKFFGELQEDPAASFTLRAPGVGTIATDPAHPWPEIGATLADTAQVGTLDFRLAAADRISLDTEHTTLEGQLAAAQTDQVGATASFAAAKASYERLKALNAEDKNVSDRVVEEAGTKLQTEEAHLAGANKTLESVQTALNSIHGKMTPTPLTVERGGQVVEVLAQPGEAVESGQAILRVARFNQLLVSVDVPAAETVPAEAATARVLPLGHETHPLTVTRVGAAATADPKTHGQILLFRVKTDNASLRPGTPITAYLPTGEAAMQGTIVPADAIIRYSGKTWAYIEEEYHTFKRTEIDLDHPVEGGYFVTQNFQSGDKVVTTGAQAVMAAEINSAGKVGGD